MAKACNKYLPARMDKRVEIRSVTQVSDGQGGFTESWSTVATVWAYIKPLKEYERMQAMQLESPRSHKITIRYRSGITADQRIVWSGRTFHIKGVINPDEANNFLELTCMETD